MAPVPTSPVRPTVIQGRFLAGQPRIPVMASLSAPIQPRLASPQPVQPRAVHPRPVQPQPVRPVALQPRVPQGPVVQRVGNGEAFQVPANLLSFGGTVGQPLPDPVRQKMESFFGASFADVRVHVGSQASSIGALAFTHGSNLYFAPGQYNPTTVQGQQLLGHELTHVVQQRTGRVRNPFGSGIAVVQDRGLEAEAERRGQQAAAAPWRPARAEAVINAAVAPRSMPVARPVAAPPVAGRIPAVQGKLKVENVKEGAELTVEEAYELVSEFFSYQNEHERRFGEDFSLILTGLVKRRSTVTFSNSGKLWEYLRRILLRQGVDIYSWGDRKGTLRQMRRSLKAAGRVREKARDKEEFSKSLSKFREMHEKGPNFEGREMTTTLYRWHLTSQLGRDLGLNRYHELALLGYSQPDKHDKKKAHYMFESETWGRYKSGWNALEEALKILPSFGELGVTAPVFRVERADSEFMKALRKYKSPVYVYHGFGRMPRGQRHQLSAGLISSSHVNKEARERGLLEFHVRSARYINAWGGMSPATDGAEVLIPAGTITLFKGKVTKKALDDNYDEVYVMVEQNPDNLNPEIPVIEDHTGRDVSKQVHTRQKSSEKTSLLLSL